MQKNLYYRRVLRRENLLKNLFFDLVDMIASYPKLMLACLIRTRLGCRHFSVATAITVGVILVLLPLMTDKIASVSFSGSGFYRVETNFWATYTTWYMFIVLFAYCAFLRWKEIRRNPSSFDFGHFSLSAGLINERFYNIRLFGKLADPRKIEIIYEPALFFIAGIILWQFGQGLGMLLIISSILYSISYASAYKHGDDMTLDIIDDIILNEEKGNAFIYDKGPEKTRGVHFHMRKPTDYDMRRKVAERLFDDTVTVAL